MIRTACLVLLLFCLPFLISAQQFGAFPPSVKWLQINTDTARIIFTKSATPEALRIATLIHKAAADTPFSMGPGLRKINIVLHNQTTLANGYVALAPFRSEYYLIPPADVFQFGNLPWYENLALHEYRHVQQYNNFRNGLSKGFYYVFGEQGLAFANAITVPDWFYEGDAVHAETALSTQGRGRLSSFLSEYNSLFVERKNYSWMKLRNGSFKDFIPDHYHLGYLMVNYGYLNYGPSFWEKVTKDATAFKGLFYPFQKAIKKYSGKDYKTFRNDALNYYRNKVTPVSTQSKQNDHAIVTNYYFPQYLSEDSLLYLKSSYKKVAAFYIKDKNGEHKIAMQSISTDNWFGYRNNKIVYTAYNTNRRWGLIDFNDIVLLDILNKTERKITHHSKYFTPDLSPDAQKIIAIEIGDSIQTKIVELDLNGRILKQYSGKDLYYTNPRYVSENTIVVGVRRIDATMSLQLLHLDTGIFEELIPYSNHTIGFPFVNNGTIYFTANFNGNDDIYSVDIHTTSVKQLTNDLLGNYYPSVFHNNIIWSHFTAEGLELQSASLSTIKSIETSVKLPIFTAPIAFENNITTVPTRNFNIQKYPKSTSLIHFHSLSPYYADPEITISLFSDNILNTFSNELYYTYNRNETSNAIGWNSSYGGFFPKINAGVEYIYNRTINNPDESFTLNELETKIGYNIPLNFTNGKTYKFLNFGSNLVFNRTSSADAFKDSFPDINITYLSHFIDWSHYTQQAVQDIYPKLGYVLSLNHRHQLNEFGYQFLADGELFLPSFANHSIVLTGSFQETDTNNVVFTNSFSMSRGYPGYYYSRMWRVSGNYNFPIAYPDFGFADLVYFKRLRGNLFYDLSRLYSNDKSARLDLRSTGAEIFFDTQWWNELPVTFGFRYSYLIDRVPGSSNSYFEIILPVNLIPGH